MGDQGIDEGDVGAVDGGRPRAAVGLQHVAVEPEGAFAEPGKVGDGAEAAADEALNLDAAAVDLAGPVAGLARARAAGKHAVLGGEPPLAAADQERRHLRSDAAGAQDGGTAHADEHAARGAAGVAALESQGAELIRAAGIVAHERTHVGRMVPRQSLQSVTKATLSAELEPNILAT